MLRSRFQSLPGALSDCLIPADKDKEPKKGLKATFSRKFAAVNNDSYIVSSLYHAHLFMFLFPFIGF